MQPKFTFHFVLATQPHGHTIAQVRIGKLGPSNPIDLGVVGSDITVDFAMYVSL